MKVEASFSKDWQGVPKAVDLVFTGSGGDEKQPIDFVYFNVTLRREAARKLAEKILKLHREWKNDGDRGALRKKGRVS